MVDFETGLFLVIAVVGTIAIVATVTVSGVFESLALRKIRKRGGTVGLMDIKCPSCRAELGSIFKKRLANRQMRHGNFEYVCNCGASSRWDVVGNPIVLVDFQVAKVSKAS